MEGDHTNPGASERAPQLTELPSAAANPDLEADAMDYGAAAMDVSWMCQSLSSMDFNLSSLGFEFNMSSCGPVVPVDPGQYDALQETHYAALVVVLYIIIILVGAIGNTMVVITVAKTKQMWNATNIFIANLAISDVFVCVLDLPLSVYYQITDRWIFGEALCHVILPAFAVVVFDSTLTLTLISIDRYLLIVFPLKKRFTVRVALILVAIIAVVSMAVASPIALYSKFVVINEPDLNIHRLYCMEQWPTPRSRLIYTVVTLLFQFFLPLLVIAILYYFIFRRVRQRMQPNSKKKSRKTRTTKMLVAVVTVFAVAWTPFHLYGMISETNKELVKGRWYKLTDVLLRGFAMSSSCINPILYAWLNDNFRNAFLGLIKVRGTGQPPTIHKEESCESTARTLVQSEASPGKRRGVQILRKLPLNGKFDLETERVEHVALTGLHPTGGLNGTLRASKASTETLPTSPLLDHKNLQ